MPRSLLRRSLRSALTLLVGAFASPLAAQVAPPAAPAPVATGVYSDSQATRGQLWYESACAACHPSRDMSSADFKLKWQGQTAFDLFDRISNTMPITAPGSLSRRTYADIVAYLLRINGAPAGAVALAADTAVLRQAPLKFGTTPATAPHRD